MNLLQAPIFENISTRNSKDVNSASSRKWIIIEDRAPKAECLVAFLMHKHPDEEIHWIYPHRSEEVPYFLNKQKEEYLYNYSKTIKLISDEKVYVKGNVYFYWCPSEKNFLSSFDIVNNGDGILLLDIDLDSLGGTLWIESAIVGKIRSFFNEQRQTLCCIISNAMVHAVARDKIASSEMSIFKRIYTDGAGDWVFNSNSYIKDCQDVIERSNAFWNRLYGKDDALNDFLNNMSKLSISDCHNWDNASQASLLSYEQRGTWHKKGIPLQLKYLADFLDFDTDDVIQIFNLRDEKGYFNPNSNICECLKYLGTRDSRRISLMGIALITWAAYRRCIGKDAQFNPLFVKTINNPSLNKEVAKSMSINPPQELETIQQTIKAYYKVLFQLFRSQSAKDYGADLVADLKFDNSGFEIRFKNIPPESLHQSILKVYRYRFLFEEEVFMKPKTESSGDTARAIVNFLALVNYCDSYVKGNLILGSYLGFQIKSAGLLSANGITLKFGYENKQKQHNSN